MSMRARPDMLDVSDDDREDYREELSEDKKKQQKAINQSKYQAPKLIPMQYNENEEEKKTKQLEKARKRAMQSSLIQDLRAQYSDAPISITEKPTISKLEKEVQNYEETNYVRYQMSKKEKQLMRRRQNQSTLDSLTKFGDYQAMDTVLEDGLKGGKRKKKSRGVKRNSGPGKRKTMKKGKQRRR